MTTVNCKSAIGYNKDLFSLIGAITGEKKNPEIINRFLESVSLTDWTSVTLEELCGYGFKPAAAQRLLSSFELVVKFNLLNSNLKIEISDSKERGDF